MLVLMLFTRIICDILYEVAHINCKWYRNKYEQMEIKAATTNCVEQFNLAFGSTFNLIED